MVNSNQVNTATASDDINKPKSAQEQPTREEVKDKKEEPNNNTPKEDKPKEDKPKEDKPKEDKPKDDTEDVKALVNAYEKKISDLKAEHDKAIKKRDAIIKQLIKDDGNKLKTSSISETINQQREYKKW